MKLNVLIKCMHSAIICSRYYGFVFFFTSGKLNLSEDSALLVNI